MSFTNPDIAKSDGNLTDKYPEGTPFIIKAAEVVAVKSTDMGEGGDMVVVTVPEPEGDKRYSIWGAYLLAQVRSAQPGDFPLTVTVARGPVEGFSERPDTKRFEPVAAPES